MILPFAVSSAGPLFQGFFSTKRPVVPAAVERRKVRRCIPFLLDIEILPPGIGSECARFTTLG